MRGLKVLAGFWAIGFVIGLIGDLLVVKAGLAAAIYAALVYVFGNALMVQGLLVGVAAGFISMVSVMAWASLSKES